MIRLAAVVFSSVFLASPLSAQDPKVLNLGIVDSLVKDLSPGKQKFVDKEFGEMIHEYTGIKIKILQGGSPFVARKNFETGAWHLGVFQGFEFAWAQAKDPKLKPLVVGLGNERIQRALVVVKKDSTLTGVADLKGKKVNLVAQSKDHCRLFANKIAEGKPKEFFGKLVDSGGEEALDELLNAKGEAVAAIVDNNTMLSYKDVVPGRYKNLKILAQSELFPLGVIAYREGGISEALLNRFKEGMLKANQSDKGREALASFHLTGLELVPADFAKQLSAILKAYPSPEK